MSRKRGRRSGNGRDRDRYLKLDAAVRLVDVLVNVIRFWFNR